MDIANMISDLSDTLVEDYKSVDDYEGLRMELIRVLAHDCPFDEEEFKEKKGNELSDQLNEAVLKTFEEKNEYMAQQAWPIIKDVYERSSHQYENIMVPISDGQRTLQINANLKKSYDSHNRELVKSFEKGAVLATIDEAWKEHLREMDELKQSVQNASYEQKDPLLIYKLESFDLFKNMMNKVNREVISLLMKGKIPLRSPEEVKEAQARKKLDMSNYETSKTDMPSYGSSDSSGSAAGGGPKKIQPIRVEKKVGRNDPCPCGSGKKFKQCHGRAGGDAVQPSA